MNHFEPAILKVSKKYYYTAHLKKNFLFKSKMFNWRSKFRQIFRSTPIFLIPRFSTSKKSTMLLNQSFPERFTSIEITHLKISSSELNLWFWTLKNTENNSVFFDEVKFQEID